MNLSHESVDPENYQPELWVFNIGLLTIFDPRGFAAAQRTKKPKVQVIMLRFKKKFKELGQKYYERQHKERVLKSLRKKARELGFSLTPVEIDSN